MFLKRHVLADLLRKLETQADKKNSREILDYYQTILTNFLKMNQPWTNN
jgi:hypothetical protein